MTDHLDVELDDRLAGLAAAVPVEAPGSTTVVRPRIRPGAMGGRFALSGLFPVLAFVVGGTILAGVARVGPFAPGATGTLSGPTEEPNGPVTTTVADGPFELTIRSAKARYTHDEPIEIDAVLTYRGPDPSTQISHDLGANGGPMAFGIIEPIPVEGGEIRLKAGYPLICRADMTPCLQPASMCVETPLRHDAKRTDGFQKRMHDGADLPDGDAAQAAAMSYLREPDLHLPPGTWHPYVIAEFSQGGVRPCSDYALRAELEIQVLEPEPIPTEEPQATNAGQTATVRDGDFELTLRSDKTTYRPNEPIDVTGSLVYSGPEDRVEVAHDSSGMILFGSREPVYGSINLSTVTRLMCTRSTLQRNVPIDMPFRKGGGFPGDHANVDFFRAFMLDPALRLPAGTWHLYAVSSGGCLAGPENPAFALEAEIAIEVSGEPVAIPRSTAVPAAPTPEIAPDESTGQIKPDGSVVDVVNDGTLELMIRAAGSVYIEGEPIDVTARLTYLGTDEAADYSGGITFSGTQVDGSHHFQRPILVAMCVRAGSVSDFPLEAALAESLPKVRSLPAGNWRITAHFSGSVPSCLAGGTSQGVGPASIDVKVVPSSELVESIPLLTGGEPSGAAPSEEFCRLAHAAGDLALHPASGLGLAQPDGRVQPIRWPFGFAAELLADGAILYGRDGDILAREGDAVGFPGGLGVDGIFTVCGAFLFP